MMEFVNWDDYSQLNGKIKHVPNHQPYIYIRNFHKFSCSHGIVFWLQRVVLDMWRPPIQAVEVLGFRGNWPGGQVDNSRGVEECHSSPIGEGCCGSSF